MLKQAVVCCALISLALAEPPVQGVKPNNVVGSSDQHASFSFVRPGLTQTAFSFSGPSSHQSFSSSIGNPQLAHKVYPNIAHALSYRNPGLGVIQVGPVANGYTATPVAPNFAPSAPLPYQAPADPVATSPYYQQLLQAYQAQQAQQAYQAQHAQQAYQAQQAQQAQLQGYSAPYQAQLAQLLALRQAQYQAQYQGQYQAQLQAQAQAQAQAQTQFQSEAAQSQNVPEQVQLQRQQEQQPTQNLLGVAYSSAPSVAHVKVTGNGYKFDF